MAQKKEYNLDNMTKEEVRKEVWQTMWDLDIKRRTYLKAKKLNALTVLPLIICSSLYTCYLSYFVPFYNIRNITKVPLIVNIKALKPIAKFFKNIFDDIPVEEPVLSIIGLVVFGFILPLVLGLIIKLFIKKNANKKYAQEYAELTGDEKEQLNKIVDKYNNTDTSCYETSDGFISLIFISLIVISVIIYIVLMCMGRLFGDMDQSVIPPLILFAVYVVSAILYGLILYIRDISIYDDMRPCREASECAEDILKKKEHEAKILGILNSGFDNLESGNYKKAEKDLSYIYNYYKEEVDLRHECTDDYAVEIIDKEGWMFHTERIEIVENEVDDANIGAALAKFKKQSNPSEQSIVEVLGEIKKHTDYFDKGRRCKSKPIKNKTVKRLCEEIRLEYESQVIDGVKADYEKGMRLFENDEYIKSMAYLENPSLMLYKDSLAAYAMAKLLGENRPDDYSEIFSNMSFAEGCGIESKELKQMVSSYKVKIQDCWRQDRKNAREAYYEAQRAQEAEEERYRRLAVCRYYNAGICNYQSGSVIHHCYHGDGTWKMCEYYKNSVY